MDKFGLEIIPYVYDNIAPNSYWSPAYYRATYNNQKGILASMELKLSHVYTMMLTLGSRPTISWLNQGN